MDPYLRDVLDVCLRMLHVVAGIAWIGASFYFVRARPRAAAAEGPGRRGGRASPASSGGSTAAASTTRRSTGSRRPRCPSRSTGSSGRRTRRGSRASRCSSSSTTSTPTCGSSTRRSPTCRRVAGDRRSRRRARARLGRLRRPLPDRRRASQAALAVVGIALVALAAWGAGELFAPRAAYLQVGAMLGTIMVANVLLRDHPRAPEARARDGGEARAGPGAAPARRRSARSTTTT